MVACGGDNFGQHPQYSFGGVGKLVLWPEDQQRQGCSSIVYPRRVAQRHDPLAQPAGSGWPLRLPQHLSSVLPAHVSHHGSFECQARGLFYPQEAPAGQRGDGRPRAAGGRVCPLLADGPSLVDGLGLPPPGRILWSLPHLAERFGGRGRGMEVCPGLAGAPNCRSSTAGCWC